MADALFGKVALQIETILSGELRVGKSIDNVPEMGPEVPEAVSNSIICVEFDNLQECIRTAHKMSEGTCEHAWELVLQHART